MVFKLLDRARMSVSGTPGTGTLTLNLATTGFQSLVTAGMANGDTMSYLIEDGTPMGSVWEIGVGTYHSSGTFTRDTVTVTSAGGTTKPSFTSAAILSAVVRAEDLMAAAGGVGATAPSVVQHTYSSVHTYDGAGYTFTNPVTVGNLIVVIANFNISDGSNGFNWVEADTQYNETSTTTMKVGYGFLEVTSANASASQTLVVGGVTGVTPESMNVLALELSGANRSLISVAEGAIGSGSTTVSASNYANSLCVFFVGGDGGANPSIIAPTSFQVSAYTASDNALKAGWATISSAGTEGVTASVASGTTRALAMNIPGV